MTGRVVEVNSKAPLAAARVMLLGTTLTATTNQDGRYTLTNVPVGTANIQVLHLGYHPQKATLTVATSQVDTVNFELTVAVVQLQEVVTTATGQQRRVELGNAISTLGDVSQRVAQTEVANVADLMVAKAPGVTVLPTSTLGGAPTVRIRGVSSISLSNAPIYYVDGVRYASDATNSGTDTDFSLLNSLDPEEIADVEIVKGPSAAALYGTNAANGVVLITTKRGQTGATRWNVFGQEGLIDDRTAYQTMYANWGHSPDDPSTDIRCQLATMGPGVCISDSLTHYNLLEDPENTFVHLGRVQSYGVSASGGTSKVRYYVSGDLDNQTGPIQMPDFEVQRFNADKVHVRSEWFHPEASRKVNLRANLSASVTPKLDVNVSTGFSKDYNRLMPESDLILSLYYIGMENYGFKGPGLDKETTDNKGTPLHDYLQWAPGDIMQDISEQNVHRITTSANAVWRPFSWMENNATVGMDNSNVYYFNICHVNECPEFVGLRDGDVTDNRSNITNYSARVLSTSTWKASASANLKTTLGADYTIAQNDRLFTNGHGLPPGGAEVTQASTRGVNSQRQPTAVKTLGLFIQEQAALWDRLFLTGAIRTDQNSAFGTDFQRVFYPKASLSWLASDESFFPKWNWMNQFRVRLSYGASGVQPGPTAALATYTAEAVSTAHRGETAADNLPGLFADSPGNPKLKPETSAEFEGGFDTQLLNNRVSLNYTYYRKETHNALISVPIAPSSAAPDLSLLQNVGSTRNSGHEVTLNAQLVDTKAFGWDVTLNGSHNTNLVVDLGTDPSTGKARVIGEGQTIRQIDGYPLNSIWQRGYTYDDKNHDGVLQVSEVHVDSAFEYVGTPSPRDLFSVQTGIDLFAHRLHLSAMFDYKGGGIQQDGANNFQCNSFPQACRETQDPSAPLAMQARAIAKTYGSKLGGTNYKTGRGYYMSDQFWKFREFSAVYTLPDAVTRLLHGQSGSNLALAVRNLFTWTSFTGIDPEANYGLGQDQVQNEFQSAAPPTFVTLRLNLKF
ncbi:MAG TPA: SusC/RagA family TonB-linked outer membrane protein [Gemmatimonadaceae bacterium]|nr:SusC/RagA family TonB-linked outer membrane protein [Gemmatimonadaceae bacterium]